MIDLISYFILDEVALNDDLNTVNMYRLTWLKARGRFDPKNSQNRPDSFGIPMCSVGSTSFLAHV